MYIADIIQQLGKRHILSKRQSTQSVFARSPQVDRYSTHIKCSVVDGSSLGHRRRLLPIAAEAHERQ